MALPPRQLTRASPSACYHFDAGLDVRTAPDRLDGIQALFVAAAQAAIAGGALLGGVIVVHAGVDGALLAGSAAASRPQSSSRSRRAPKPAKAAPSEIYLATSSQRSADHIIISTRSSRIRRGTRPVGVVKG